MIKSKTSFLIEEWTWITKVDVEGYLLCLLWPHCGHMVGSLRTGWGLSGGPGAETHSEARLLWDGAAGGQQLRLTLLCGSGRWQRILGNWSWILTRAASKRPEWQLGFYFFSDFPECFLAKEEFPNQVERRAAPPCVCISVSFCHFQTGFQRYFNISHADPSDLHNLL